MIKPEFVEFIRFTNRVADELEENAGFSGSRDDGGARALRDAVTAFEAGLKGQIPKALSHHYENFCRSKDPKYQQYLELKAIYEPKS